jgi:preprotein translocase subunit SecA
MSSALLAADGDLANSVYLERSDPREGAFDRRVRAWLDAASQRLRPLRPMLAARVREAGRLCGECERLSDAEVCRQLRIAAREALGPRGSARALALVREAARRSLGLRPFDTQLMGAAVVMTGRLAEMQTGEGKTLTAALGAAIVACAGVPVHVVTVNDYLAQRDADEMRPLFAFLGLDVGSIVSGMELPARRAAYACDVTWCVNKELVFDYLKDRVAAAATPTRAQMRLHALTAPGQGGAAGRLLLRGLHFAIVDEADSVLIDEARTPLILAEKGARDEDHVLYAQALELARALQADLHYELSAARRALVLLPAGRAELARVATELGGIWAATRAREELASQALRALHLFHRDHHYILAEGKVQIVDEFTGRVLDGRTWEQGLHQLIEVKEGCELSDHARTTARITYQRFFRRYLRLAGMTGTASEVAGELREVYALQTVTLPTHRPSRRVRRAHVCCADAPSKWQRVAEDAAAAMRRGQPVLVGTKSVQASEQLAEVLRERGLDFQLLNARQDAEEAAMVARAGEPGRLTVATNMAGRGTDIRLAGGVDEAGGLHVILTEFHESARIDRQLFGRCARQGNAGSAVAIVALDDALFAQHGRDLVRLVQWLQALCPGHAVADLLRRLCQRRAGRHARRVRDDTMKRDRDVDSMLAFAGRSI